MTSMYLILLPVVYWTISTIFSVIMFYLGLSGFGQWYHYYKNEDDLTDESSAGGNAAMLMLSLITAPIIMPYYTYIYLRGGSLWQYQPWKLD